MADGTKAPKYFSEIIPKSTVDKWLARKNQIAMVKLFAPNFAMHLFEEELTDKKVFFCRLRTSRRCSSSRVVE